MQITGRKALTSLRTWRILPVDIHCWSILSFVHSASLNISHILWGFWFVFVCLKVSSTVLGFRDTAVNKPSLVAQTVKNTPAVQKTQVWCLVWEGPQEKKTATHSSILAWRIPWTEEPGGLQSMELERVRHDWAAFTFIFFQWTRHKKKNHCLHGAYIPVRRDSPLVLAHLLSYVWLSVTHGL